MKTRRGRLNRVPGHFQCAQSVTPMNAPPCTSSSALSIYWTDPQTLWPPLNSWALKRLKQQEEDAIQLLVIEDLAETNLILKTIQLAGVIFFFFLTGIDILTDFLSKLVRAWPWTFPVAVDVKCSGFLVISTLLTSLGAAVPLYNSL